MSGVDLKDYDGQKYYEIRDNAALDKKDPLLNIKTDFMLANQLQVLRELGCRPDGFEPTVAIHEPVNAANGEPVTCTPSL